MNVRTKEETSEIDNQEMNVEPQSESYKESLQSLEDVPQSKWLLVRQLM